MIVREATINDLPRLLHIYNEVVRSSAATFDLEEQTIEQRAEWFSHHGGRYPLIVCEIDGRVAGYASLSLFRTWEAYAGTVESSVYVDRIYQRQGIGRALMKEILCRASAFDYHVVIAAITSDNAVSISLHLGLGFTFAGCLKEVGRKFARWHDVHFYQLILG